MCLWQSVCLAFPKRWVHSQHPEKQKPVLSYTLRATLLWTLYESPLTTSSSQHPQGAVFAAAFITMTQLLKKPLRGEGFVMTHGSDGLEGFLVTEASPSWNIWDRGCSQKKIPRSKPPSSTHFWWLAHSSKSSTSSWNGARRGTRWSNTAAGEGTWTLKHYKSAPLLSWSSGKEMEEYRSQVIYLRADC